MRNDSTKYEDIVSLLLQGRADPNMQDELGNTPLMHAAMNGDVNMVRILLKHGAKYFLQNVQGDWLRNPQFTRRSNHTSRWSTC